MTQEKINQANRLIENITQTKRNIENLNKCQSLININSVSENVLTVNSEAGWCSCKISLEETIEVIKRELHRNEMHLSYLQEELSNL